MSTERILVVDDSPTQLEAARALLELRGYDVVVARSGEAALDRVRAESFDLVLSDVIMPGMSGYDLCSAIRRELDTPPPIVLLTSLNDPRDIVRGVECGADNYITKPYEPTLLADRIRHVIDNHRLRMQAPSEGPVQVNFLGETYTIASDPAQILALLLSSFEELIRTNAALQESKRQVAAAHARELQREQEARARAEADARNMEQLKRKAEAATRARDDVLAAVSHDLKNPLGTIYTSAALLLDMEMAPEAQRRQMDIIRRTARRMDRLIQDLLDVSRMEAGRFSVEAQEESGRALVLEAQDLHASLASAKHIDLGTDLPDEDVVVHADRHRVLQVLSNLIGNAVKFTPDGGRITIRLTKTDGHARFEVSDTGVGIPAADLPRIFDRFWHAGEGGGSGLGLAIAQGIVQAHGGDIRADSSDGGTTFSFTLPLAAPSLSARE
ncbi:MAG TPA: hybrid sensor histidine kinase/response regulator [Longimicrobiales bacterium]|nr:hybrid sensor histidine kinase/response regulator [Longimicrobiales bacterium]